MGGGALLAVLGGAAERLPELKPKSNVVSQGGTRPGAVAVGQEGPCVLSALVVT